MCTVSSLRINWTSCSERDAMSASPATTTSRCFADIPMDIFANRHSRARTLWWRGGDRWWGILNVGSFVLLLLAENEMYHNILVRVCLSVSVCEPFIVAFVVRI